MRYTIGDQVSWRNPDFAPTAEHIAVAGKGPFFVTGLYDGSKRITVSFPTDNPGYNDVSWPVDWFKPAGASSQ